MEQYPDGLRGPLIVHDPKDPFAGQYDHEIILSVTDWYGAQCCVADNNAHRYDAGTIPRCVP